MKVAVSKRTERSRSAAELPCEERAGVVERDHEKVQNGHEEKLVVGERLAEKVEQAIQRKDTRAVENAEQEAPPAIAGRGRGIRDEEVEAEKDGDGNPGVDEPVGPGGGAVHAREEEQHARRGERHERYAKEKLRDEADGEEKEIRPAVGIDETRVERRRQLGDPGGVGLAGRDQHHSEEEERECRRIEDVRSHAIAVPDDEFLRQEADRNQDELVGEPVVLERQKQIGAEDDRQRPEA